MIDAIFEGLFFGFVLSFMLGPSFFLILETSIRDGIRAALILDLGVLVGDVIYIWIALHFFTEKEAIEAHEHLITFLTGLLLIVFGLYQFLKKKKPMHKVIDPKEIIVHTRSKELRLFIKGLIINIINPTILIYWFGMIFVGYSKNALQDHEMLVFLLSILVSFFSIDVLKIIGARQLKKVVTPEFIHYLNRAIGVILFLFGSVMLVKGLIAFL